MPCFFIRLCLFFLLMAVCVDTAQAQSFPPPAAPQDASLSVFLERLRKAIHDRDEAFILSLVHDDCEVSFGGFRGPDDFQEYWFGPASHGHDFFDEMQVALDLGGAWKDGGADFVLPYTALAPAVDQDGVLLGVLPHPAVNVRAWPGMKGRLVATIGHELVRLCNIEVPIAVDGLDWTCILLPDGRRGYVATQYITMPSAKRVVLRKYDDRWLIVSTVAN